MRRKKIIRIAFVILAAIVAFFAMADSLGWFDNKPYREVPHGNHSHYVPLDRNPNVSISEFPTRPPRRGERITPYGEIVPDSLGEWW